MALRDPAVGGSKSEIKTAAKHVVIADRKPSDGGSIPPASTKIKAVEVIASRLTNQIVISNVGNTNRELYSVKKHKLTLHGVNMSLVTPLAFRLAKAIPQRKVIASTATAAYSWA